MYAVYLSKKAAKQYTNVDEQIRGIIDEKIKKLQSNPYPEGTKEKKKLKYCNLADYRIKANGYRVLYDIYEKDKEVLILLIRKKDKKTYK